MSDDIIDIDSRSVTSIQIKHMCIKHLNALNSKEIRLMDRSSKIELTNMCLIYDENRVLVQEKQGLKEKSCRA